MKHRLLWVTDPWDTLDHPRDTSLRLLEEALALGLECHWCDVRSIRLETDRVLADAREITAVAAGRDAGAFRMEKTRAVRPREFGRILYRPDPPVDLGYLHPLQLLALDLEGHETRRKDGPEIVNPPEALALANEKTEAALLEDLAPPCMVSSRWEMLAAFGREHGRTVLKPLHEAQSKGVEQLNWSSEEGIRAARFALMAPTAGFTRPVVLQKFYASVAEQGELRLWFLNGKLLAHARKLPRSGEFRIDMDAGGTLARAELSESERRSVQKIGKRLRARRIRMAAVDLIEELVTDFNVTSPGLLVPMEALEGRNLARPIVESLIEPWES
jgi:glutathione synthase